MYSANSQQVCGFLKDELVYNVISICVTSRPEKEVKVPYLKLTKRLIVREQNVLHRKLQYRDVQV